MVVPYAGYFLAANEHFPDSMIAMQPRPVAAILPTSCSDSASKSIETQKAGWEEVISPSAGEKLDVSLVRLTK